VERPPLNASAIPYAAPFQGAIRQDHRRAKKSCHESFVLRPWFVVLGSLTRDSRPATYLLLPTSHIQPPTSYFPRPTSHFPPPSPPLPLLLVLVLVIVLVTVPGASCSGLFIPAFGAVDDSEARQTTTPLCCANSTLLFTSQRGALPGLHFSQPFHGMTASHFRQRLHFRRVPLSQQLPDFRRHGA
jgi:hypothetical protein